MSTELSKEDKVDIVNQHIRNLQINKYNLNLSMLEESSATVPNQSTVDTLQLAIAELDGKISALNTELENLNS